MIVKCLAALLLLPASFTVYGSPSAWLRAWRGGVRAFFIPVIKQGPHVVPRPASLLRGLPVYYAMRTGLELLRAGAIRPVLRRAAAFLFLRLSGGPVPEPAAVPCRTMPPLAFVPPDRIEALLREPDIRIVSFDIFDTLLLRPVLDPADVFLLIGRRTDPVYGTDFAAMRRTAEAETGLVNARLDDIYTCMARRHGLGEAVREALKAEEIRCERTILTPRPDAQRLHAEARRLGKRIIAVSDMYLPSALLADILREKGLAVDAVYVSCEHNARKSDGSLYDRVLEAEGVPPHAILHVGDNRESDCAQALGKRMCAVQLPSVRETLSADPGLRDILCGEALQRDPLAGLYLGHAFNRLYGTAADAPENPARVRDLRHLCELTLGPLLTAFALFVATDKGIQSGYNTLFFASRDGRLPCDVYNMLRERFNAVPGRYFYAGRRAYFPLLYDTFFDFARSLSCPADSTTYTLRRFLHAWFADTPLLHRMEAALPEKELDAPFFADTEARLAALQPFNAEIDALLQARREAARTYYRSVFGPGRERRLVFDLGYSGSVSRALCTALECPVDKLYFWESEANREADRKDGTETRLFMGDRDYVPINLIYEELFSPLEGDVVGFDPQGTPLAEPLPMPGLDAEAFASAARTCLDWAGSFADVLGEYAACARLDRPDAFNAVLKALLWDVPYCNAAVLRHIRFPDPVFQNCEDSLERKLDKNLAAGTVFTATGFENPEHVFTETVDVSQSPLRIGIHVHLFHIDMADELVRYLQDFPTRFDLYVTVTDTAFAPAAQKLFGPALLPRIGLLKIVPVPNRGRDVAPWILTMRPWQGAYDLFCHVHTKASAHIGFGDRWRRYLFDNLIRADAAARVIDIFTRHPDLGCLFPGVYSRVRRVLIHANTHANASLYGSEHEYNLITALLKRMDLEGELRRSELFFSVGTMFWYRPQALRQLFSVPLELEEFEPEPIGVGGTLAHAVERLPGLVAVRNGYAVRTFTPHGETSKQY